MHLYIIQKIHIRPKQSTKFTWILVILNKKMFHKIIARLSINDVSFIISDKLLIVATIRYAIHNKFQC